LLSYGSDFASIQPDQPGSAAAENPPCHCLFFLLIYFAVEDEQTTVSDFRGRVEGKICKSLDHEDNSCHHSAGSIPEYIALGREIVATNRRPRARLPKDHGNYPCHRALVSHIEKYGLIDRARS